MPTTLELQAEFAEVVQVLFVAPAQTAAEIRAFGAERGWFGNRAMWTHEAPLKTSARYPAFALLSPEGRVVMEGSAASRQRQVRDYLEGLVS